VFDLRHPFFAPLWRRVLTSGLVAAWAFVELLAGNPGWAALCGAILVWTVYAFFIVFDPADYKDNNNG